ncbi:GNAT family N-acetyltransferase [Ralstonia sp. 1B3]|uniref:GNAT family N-acetyltransferase n=1 Tax=Ralstonia sp. 1B3 TaxID=2997421 RepID=UPI002FC7F6D4
MPARQTACWATAAEPHRCGQPTRFAWHCLASSAQGKGHGRAACEAAFAYASETLCLRKITLEVLAENTRAIALYEKLDFRTVGTLAGHYLQDNRWHDVVLMERMLSS